MDKFLIKFNELSNNKYDFLRINKVNLTVSKHMVSIDFLLPEEKYSLIEDDNFKKEVFDISSKIITYPFGVEIHFTKSALDDTFVLKDILDIINSKFPALNTAVKEQNITFIKIDDIFTIKFKLEKSAYSYFKNCKVDDRLIKILSHKYANIFSIKYDIVDDKLNYIDLEKSTNNSEISSNINSPFIQLDEVEAIYGRDISSQAKYLREVKDEANYTVHAGKIQNMAKFKRKNADTHYFSFTLDDTTGTIKAMVFPRIYKGKNSDDKAMAKYRASYDKKVEILDKIVEDSAMGDMEVVCEGNIVKSSYNDEFTYFVNKISTCKIDYSQIKHKVSRKSIPEEYTKIQPKLYIDSIISETKFVPGSLKDKKIVVFDFETTGINKQTDTPIEIGAVSIVDGKISEEFATFINPRRVITPEITKLTHITNEDVADAPYIEDIIPDFYKFCENAILVAHNIDFDYAFLHRYSHEKGYFFDNIRHDTLTMSRKLIKGLRSYKLSSLCENQGIVNEGAHRAIYDAIATARLYIKLVDML